MFSFPTFAHASLQVSFLWNLMKFREVELRLIIGRIYLPSEWSSSPYLLLLHRDISVSFILPCLLHIPIGSPRCHALNPIPFLLSFLTLWHLPFVLNSPTIPIIRHSHRYVPSHTLYMLAGPFPVLFIIKFTVLLFLIFHLNDPLLHIVHSIFRALIAHHRRGFTALWLLCPHDEFGSIIIPWA